MFRCIRPRQHQHIGFFGPFFRPLLAAIAQIAPRDPARNPVQQGQYWNAVVPVSRCQDEIDDAPVNMAQYVELEPENHPLLVLPPSAPSSRSRRTRRWRRGWQTGIG